jgi:hypothetical protein
MGPDGLDVRFQAGRAICGETYSRTLEMIECRALWSVLTVALTLAFDRSADFTRDRGRGWQVVV